MKILLVHPINGSGYAAHSLNHFLTPYNHSVHEIPVSNLLTTQTDFTIRQLAKNYIEYILKFPPPYLIAGFCVGGLVALEIAHIFYQENISFNLLLFDTPNPLSKQRKETAMAKWESKKEERYLKNINNGLPERIAYQQLIISESFLKALINYQPKPFYFSKTVYFFHPVENQKSFRDSKRIFSFNPWQKNGLIDLLNNKLEIIKIPGRHGAFMRKPYVRIFAKELAKLLDSIP